MLHIIYFIRQEAQLCNINFLSAKRRKYLAKKNHFTGRTSPAKAVK